MIPQPLIERVAERLYALEPLLNLDGVPYTWQQLDAFDLKYKAKSFAQAKTALQSLGDEWCLVPREPTPEMMEIIEYNARGDDPPDIWKELLKRAGMPTSHAQPDTVKE